MDIETFIHQKINYTKFSALTYGLVSTFVVAEETRKHPYQKHILLIPTQTLSYDI